MKYVKTAYFRVKNFVTGWFDKKINWRPRLRFDDGSLPNQTAENAAEIIFRNILNILIIYYFIYY